MSATEADVATDLYVYGVVPADAQLPESMTGVNGAILSKLGDGMHAAVVTEIDDAEGLGTPGDLLAHSRVLDSIAAAGPVLPMTFATVVADPGTIVNEVLPSMHDEYAAGLRRVDGAVQFAVRARYVQETLLGEMVATHPEIARLREATADQPPEASHYDRIRLGELVVDGFARAAAADAPGILDRLRPLARELATREAGQADDVLEVAALVEREHQDAFEQAVETLAAEARGRINFRLLGPQAPYDFVGEV